ncbi:MAG: hypothetical protein ACPIOQ_29140, partial [Promethearchaeia archaeon]
MFNSRTVALLADLIFSNRLTLSGSGGGWWESTMGGKVSKSHDSSTQDVQAAAKTAGQGGMGAAQENSATAGARAAANGKGWGSEGVQASTPDAKKSLPGTQHAVQEVGAGVEIAPVRAPA